MDVVTRLDGLTFRRHLKGRLKLGAEALGTMDELRQRDPRAPEAGGVLIGRWLLDGDDVVIDLVTRPSSGDRSARTSFHRSRGPHQGAIDAAWRSSGGKQTWLGEWHSHPEANPSPSSVDLHGWARRLRFDRAPGPSLFFVIVGIEQIRVWEGLRSSGRIEPLRFIEPPTDQEVAE